MPRILKNLLIISVIIFLFQIINVCASDLPPLPNTGKQHYIVYREGSRDNRIEVAFYNLKSDYPNHVVWADDLQLLHNDLYIDGEKWFLNGNVWEKFEEDYHCISNHVGDVIESSLEIRDYRENGVTEGIIEVIKKERPMNTVKRLWNGSQFAWIEQNGKEMLLYHSETGLDLEGECIPVLLPMQEDVGTVFQADGSLIIVKRDHFNANTHIVVVNDSFEIVFEDVVSAELVYVYTEDGYMYFTDGYNQNPPFWMPRTGYRTKDGITWEILSAVAVTPPEATEDKTFVNQNNYMSYNLENRNTKELIYVSHENSEIKYGFIRETYGDDADFYQKNNGVVGMLENENKYNIFGFTDFYGIRSEEINGKVRYEERYRLTLSLDGVNGITLPVLKLSDYAEGGYNGGRNYWCDDNYVYVDASDYEYYRIPVEAFLKPIIVYNGNVLAFNNPPVMESDRTLIPMRFLFEQMGADVFWDETTNTATVSKASDVVSFSIDNTVATVNAQPKTMDVPARLINDKTYIPLRFLSEELGYTVEWDEETNTVIITE